MTDIGKVVAMLREFVTMCERGEITTRTPASGGASTPHMFQLEASTVWFFDRLRKALPEYLEQHARTAPEMVGAGKAPCGECHLKPGEVCDICGAKAKATTPVSEAMPEMPLFEQIAHVAEEVALREAQLEGFGGIDFREYPNIRHQLLAARAVLGTLESLLAERARSNSERDELVEALGDLVTAAFEYRKSVAAQADYHTWVAAGGSLAIPKAINALAKSIDRARALLSRIRSAG